MTGYSGNVLLALDGSRPLPCMYKQARRAAVIHEDISTSYHDSGPPPCLYVWSFTLCNLTFTGMYMFKLPCVFGRS